jgi:hypothetical protein
MDPTGAWSWSLASDEPASDQGFLQFFGVVGLLFSLPSAPLFGFVMGHAYFMLDS